MIGCNTCEATAENVKAAREAGWKRKWRRLGPHRQEQIDVCADCRGKTKREAFAHCPNCPFCQTEAPTLMAHTDNGTLHWSCHNAECRARWRLQVAKTPADYGEPLPMADDDPIVGADAFYTEGELRQ